MLHFIAARAKRTKAHTKRKTRSIGPRHNAYQNTMYMLDLSVPFKVYPYIILNYHSADYNEVKSCK